MATKNIIARGIGFNPESLKFIVTGGFLSAVTSSNIAKSVSELSCDVCGFTYNHDAILRGFTRDHHHRLVCKFDYDAPHPNDRKPLVRSVRPAEPVR